MYKNLNTNQL